MEFTKQDIEDMAAPAIKVVAQPILEASINRERLIVFVRGLYPDESADFKDDEIIRALGIYSGKSNGEMIAAAGKHLGISKVLRAAGQVANNDPSKLTDSNSNPLIGKSEKGD
jgi:hypothetical protein